MTSQRVSTQPISEEMLARFHELSPEHQQQVFDFVEFLAQRQASSTENDVTEREPKPSKRRVLGQHKGMGWIREDFNDPLPDEFWLGKEGKGISSL